MNARDRGVSTETRTPLDAEGPLRRWARRRRDVAREAQAEAGRDGETRETHTAPEVRSDDAVGESPQARQSSGEASDPAAVEEKPLTDEDMPPLHMLDADSDYSGFLSPGVSESLRRRALRKLFSSAVFNVPDGLDDYDDDFTSFAALGDIVTSDMKHQAEVEAERAEQARAGTEAEDGFESDSSPVEDEPPTNAGDETPDRAQEKPAAETEPGELPVPPGSAAPQADADEGATSRAQDGSGDETEPGELPAALGPAAPQADADGSAMSGVQDGSVDQSESGATPALRESVPLGPVAAEDAATSADLGPDAGRRT